LCVSALIHPSSLPTIDGPTPSWQAVEARSLGIEMRELHRERAEMKARAALL
jgi:hypothetical protein